MNNEVNRNDAYVRNGRLKLHICCNEGPESRDVYCNRVVKSVNVVSRDTFLNVDKADQNFIFCWHCINAYEKER